ncbi:hypothetical protein [[Leptolyngbya] sp. PCC 7376]|uniref:hypothetical protein n=1 Tax=[Leptolyngbya] sp. PCC 7376 TaxID=111781 RepID=UPI0002E2CB5D|nr:hypothetical protein [[Leptolyngbya] sp. PCC 7376]
MVMVNGHGDRLIADMVRRSPRFERGHLAIKFFDDSTEKSGITNPFMACNIFYNGRVYSGWREVKCPCPTSRSALR